MVWVKGQSGNPAGRQAGKRSMPVGDMLVFRASQSGNAYVFLKEVMDDERVPMDIRVIAAREIRKHQQADDPPLENPVPLIEHPICAADAAHNVGTINYFEASGRIGPRQAASLRQGQLAWVDAHMVEWIQTTGKDNLEQFAALREHIASSGQTVIGGLPALYTGTDKDGNPVSGIDMPKGHEPWTPKNGKGNKP
jgi:hypothetical protein